MLASLIGLRSAGLQSILVWCGHGYRQLIFMAFRTEEHFHVVQYPHQNYHCLICSLRLPMTLFYVITITFIYDRLNGVILMHYCLWKSLT